MNTPYVAIIAMFPVNISDILRAFKYKLKHLNILLESHMVTKNDVLMSC
jgi:hypothetical protein